MKNAEHKTHDTALVLGLGDSGDAAARLLAGEGCKVSVADAGTGEGLNRRAAGLERMGVEVHLGNCQLPAGRFDICVVSPGIPGDSQWVREAESRGIETLGELELGWRRRRFKVLAVTGSNGKSTLTKLCAESLERAGCRTAIGGNYGAPLSEIVLKAGQDACMPDWVVVEVSSFQMEKAVDFRPEVGILLNLNPNHLDRHGGMREYAALKWRIFGRMKDTDAGVIPFGLAPEGAAINAPSRIWRRFGTDMAADCMYRAGGVVCRDSRDGKPGPEDISLKGTMFDNEVLGMSAASAAAAVRACGFSASCVEQAAATFEPLPHRAQKIGEINGVEFVNDSKATNLAAMCAAVRMCTRPVRLIAGGRLKEGDLASVLDVLAGKVVSAYLIGEAKYSLASAWGNRVQCHLCVNLDEAVTQAWKEAQRGEVILLSPACTSFDQFKNFKERGERFVQLTHSLAEKEKEQ